MSKRSEGAAETRQALIAAGLELFGEQGLDGPSLDAICSRAGRTRGAFYVHFADRDAFLEAVMEQAGEAFLSSVIGDGEADLATIVQRFVASVASGAYPLTRPGGPRPHQLLDACARSEVIRKRYVALIEEALGRLRKALETGGGALKAPGERASFDPDLLARLLLAAVIGAQTMLELGMPLDVARAGALVTSLWGAPATKARAPKKAPSAPPFQRTTRAEQVESPRARGRARAPVGRRAPRA